MLPRSGCMLPVAVTRVARIVAQGQVQRQTLTIGNSGVYLDHVRREMQ